MNVTTDTTIGRSNSLADLAARIKAEHEAIGLAAKRGLEHAMRAGDMLLEAKAQLKHGQWTAWLKQHCALSERDAQRYMRLAKRRSLIEAKSDKLSDLRVSGALALLALPKHGRDDFIKDLGELAEKTVDSASDFTEMETQSEKAEFQLQHQRDVLIVKADRQEPLVVVRLSLAAEIAKGTAK
jgi:hypothetical protein